VTSNIVTMAGASGLSTLSTDALEVTVTPLPLLDTVAFALCGAVTGLGIWVALGTVLGWPVADRRMSAGTAVVSGPVGGLIRLSGTARVGVAAAVMAGAMAAIAVQLPVLILLAVGAVLVAVEAARGPSVTEVTTGGAAIASWCETIRQELTAGQPQRAALIAACDSPPAGLAAPLARLATRLETMQVPDALWAFAREVRHPAAGTTVAALDVAYRLGAGDLPKLMAGQVETTRHQVQVLREVHAARAKHRRAMLLILGLFIVVITGLFALWPDFFTAYRGVQGQAVLAGIGAVVLVAVRALIRLGQPELPPAFFTGPASSPQVAGEPAGVSASRPAPAAKGAS
jgi:tight adherence protein B